MRARVRDACDGLGWCLSLAALLAVLAVLNLLLSLVLESSANEPLRLGLASWLVVTIPAALAVTLVVAGVLRRHIVRNPKLEDFGFGYGIDPEFIQHRLDPPGRNSITTFRPTAKT